MGITGGNPGFIGGGGAASIAAGDITDVGATGVDLVQAETAADVLAALYPWTAVSLASGTGWTDDVSGTGSAASITGGAIVVTTGGSGVLARIGRAVPWTGGRVQVRARIASTDITGSAELSLFLCDSASSAAVAGLTVYGDGTARARTNSADAGTIAVASLLAGQGWMLLDLAGGVVDAHVGVGSGGSPPTSWTHLGSATLGGSRVPWAAIRVQLNASDAKTASVDSLAWRSVAP